MNCNGFMGFILGHKFEEVVIEQKLPKTIAAESGHPNKMRKIVDQVKINRYVEVCRRCGLQKEQDFVLGNEKG